MAPESFTLSPCTLDDVEAMISVYMNAFKNDYFSSFTFPATISPEERYRWLRERFTGTFSKPDLRNFKIVETSTGRMAAWARWGFPHEKNEVKGEGEGQDEKEEEKDFNKDEWPVGANLEVCEVKFGGLHRKREKYCKKEDTYIVYLICTDPAFQRKGLASRLLQHGIDLADREGRQTYLEATKDGHPVYLKLGFTVIDVLTMDLSKWGGKELGVSRMMMRDPKPAN
ncbi:hypothetical protein D0Z07_3877 [Hyphodiscus hymeniophilus]|uniref:N-acetyltransferase domain-containing protein n=1 Tax=Hyphodiscus hymeniophilus TaxID=353542 RepID=A0A9P6VLQ0_9HELO|nr:hypothetical protein D0Z07_3877 [Hyphodiscus hymeniophilus]